MFIVNIDRQRRATKQNRRSSQTGRLAFPIPILAWLGIIITASWVDADVVKWSEVEWSEREMEKGNEIMISFKIRNQIPFSNEQPTTWNWVEPNEKENEEMKPANKYVEEGEDWRLHNWGFIRFASLLACWISISISRHGKELVKRALAYISRRMTKKYFALLISVFFFLPHPPPTPPLAKNVIADIWGHNLCSRSSRRSSKHLGLLKMKSIILS